MSQEALTQEQRELLSAFMDGEVSASERAAAEELLRREDARACLKGLQGARKLVADHAAVKAPASIQPSVSAAIAPKAKVQQLPGMGWKVPVYSIAASLLIALAIMFGPWLIQPEPVTTHEISRELLQPAAPADKEAAYAGTALESQAAEAQTAMRPAELAEVQELRRQEDARDTSAEREVGLGGAPGVSPPAPRASVVEDAVDTAEAEAGAARMARSGGISQRRARGSADGAALPEFVLQSANLLAAQNDALWIASLHGSARLLDENGVESIRVELPVAVLPDLLRALEQLAQDQGYGQPGRPARALDNDERESRVEAYLPKPREPQANEPTTTLIVRIRSLE